ncbi:hypothetical protein [Actinophytocola sp.]|uniref:hypothetical protein n=1 Tax=Actinophytocola sp. TaxID=1872138 RepID=UPI002EDB1722
MAVTRGGGAGFLAGGGFSPVAGGFGVGLGPGGAGGGVSSRVVGTTLDVGGGVVGAAAGGGTGSAIPIASTPVATAAPLDATAVAAPTTIVVTVRRVGECRIVDHCPFAPRRAERKQRPAPRTLSKGKATDKHGCARPLVRRATAPATNAVAYELPKAASVREPRPVIDPRACFEAAGAVLPKFSRCCPDIRPEFPCAHPVTVRENIRHFLLYYALVAGPRTVTVHCTD